MKKLIIAIVAIIAIGTSSAYAQKSIGVRFGGGNLVGGEISFQTNLGSNRVELDLGGSFGEYSTYLSIAGIYQWHNNIVGGLNWYIGPGVAAGIYMSDIVGYAGATVAVGGQVGIEYNFSSLNVPLIISFDTRPMINLHRPDSYDSFGWSVCGSIRYLF